HSRLIATVFTSSIVCLLPALHSFPTRRSSDLVRRRRHVVGRRHVARRRHVAGRGHVAGRSVERHVGRRTVVASVTGADGAAAVADRKSTRLNSSHLGISYAVFCLKKKTQGYWM